MRKINRRKFLKVGGVALGGVLVSGGTYSYLNDERMERGGRRGEKIIADLHCHPADYYGVGKTLEMLCAPGIVGLSWINDGRQDRGWLRYEKALRFYGAREIDKLGLAKIETKRGRGYFMRTQEITGDIFHVLAVGFEGNYIPNFVDVRKAVEVIHKQNGLAILNHPYVTLDECARLVRYRLITTDEEELAEIHELCEMVDEIEVFNAQSINPTFGIGVPNMKEANKKGEELAKRYGFKGVASSDTHRRLEQVKICGIYVEEKDLCIEKLKEDILRGNFERHGGWKEGPYVSRKSFLQGMFLG